MFGFSVLYEIRTVVFADQGERRAVVRTPNVREIPSAPVDGREIVGGYAVARFP